MNEPKLPAKPIAEAIASMVGQLLSDGATPAQLTGGLLGFAARLHKQYHPTSTEESFMPLAQSIYRESSALLVLTNEKAAGSN